MFAKNFKSYNILDMTKCFRNFLTPISRIHEYNIWIRIQEVTTTMDRHFEILPIFFAWILILAPRQNLHKVCSKQRGKKNKISVFQDPIEQRGVNKSEEFIVYEAFSAVFH